MEWLRGWLLGVTAAALAVALAQALTPEGTVKKVGRLVGGLVLLLAVARPLLRLEPGALEAALPAWAGPEAEQAAQGGEDVMKSLIARKAGAYIVDKAGELGAVCRAEVAVSEGEAGWPVPWSAVIAGTWTAEQQRALSQAVADDLDIPKERQEFREETGAGPTGA